MTSPVAVYRLVNQPKTYFTVSWSDSEYMIHAFYQSSKPTKILDDQMLETMRSLIENPFLHYIDFPPIARPTRWDVVEPPEKKVPNTQNKARVDLLVDHCLRHGAYPHFDRINDAELKALLPELVRRLNK
jgi:hypothetical protein